MDGKRKNGYAYGRGEKYSLELGGDGKEFIAFDMNEHFSTPPHNQRRWAGRCLPWNCPHAESSRRSHCRGK